MTRSRLLAAESLRQRQRRRFGRVEGAIVLAGLVVVAVVGGVTVHSASTFSRAIPLSGVSQDIQLHLTLSHLGLEESLAGDAEVNVAVDVVGNLDEAQALCQAMLRGGNSRFGWVEPMRGAMRRKDVAGLCQDIAAYRGLTQARLDNRAASGTVADRAYDASFNALLVQADRDVETMRGEIAADEASQDRINWALLAILALLFAGVALMVSFYRRALHSRTEQMTRLASIVESSDEAIIGKTRAGIITTWNRGAERLYGYRRVEVVGGSINVLVPADLLAEEKEIRLAALRGEMRSNYETLRLRKDGTTVPVSLTVSPIYDADRVAGISAISHDITERKRTEAELVVARTEAIESSRQKSEFLATMSHEIRTPMNGVIGLSGLLLDTDLDATQRQYAEGVHTAGDALLTVINDILDFSKLEAGKVELEEVTFDPRRLVDDVGALLAEPAQSKNLELVAYCLPDVPARLRGDPGRIRQVLLNLTSNAVKFTAEGEVVIRARLAREGADAAVVVRFEVIDTGIGIAPADRERLFEPFSQADASTTRHYGGTGLGLAICRRLTEAMGGEMGLTGEVGQGSTFWFALPLSRAAAAPDAVEPQSADDILPGLRVLVVDDNETNRRVLSGQLDKWRMRPDTADGAGSALARLAEASVAGDPYQMVLLDMCMPDVDGLQLARIINAEPALNGTKLILLTSAMGPAAEAVREAGIGAMLTKPARESELCDQLMHLTAPRQIGAAAVPQAALVPARPAERGRVLVVEDNTINQLVAEALVSRLGYQVDIVANGLLALRAVAGADYAAVLMDCHMPEMDGFEATAEIRRREAGLRHTPIIAMTAGARPEDRDRCLAAGMDDYVSKPVNAKALELLLTRWVPASAQVPASHESSLEPAVDQGPP